MTEKIKGRISSFQSMGTLDGPGVRFVVFTQGCPLRCACCHNPETWDKNGGRVYTAEEVNIKNSSGKRAELPFRAASRFCSLSLPRKYLGFAAKTK